jgi:hypothetical protein
MNLENATPFGALVMPSSDRAGRDLLLIVVGAQFALPVPGDEDPQLRLFPIQETPPMSDEYFGEPGQSSILREGQSPYTKPATDICVSGSACAPAGQAVTAMTVSIRVGPCALDLRVSGDRVWQRGITTGARPSEPAPFARMPLVWERAYGGVAASSTEQRPRFEPRNPIGCGLETDANDAIGRPVPNIEHPRQLLQSVSERPQPVGTTPVGRHWQPRVNFAGTYDEAWRRNRAPLWPDDLDVRFFCGAPPYLQASPHLVGGEPVVLSGLHRDGPIGFRLPTLQFTAVSRFGSRTILSTPIMDGVVIESDRQRLTLYYRAAVPAPLSLVKHRGTRLQLSQVSKRAVTA